MDISIRPLIPEAGAIAAFGVACAVAVGYGCVRTWRWSGHRTSASSKASSCRPAPSGARTADALGEKFDPALLLCLVCVATGALFYLPYTNDDAFIFFRYARNLAQGQGAVFNPGERVEGFTSPAWVAILAAAGLARFDLVWTGKLLGVVAALLATLLFYRAAGHAFGRGIGFACALGLATQQLFLSWIGSGMDVALFLLFQCVLITLFVDESPPSVALLVTAAGVFIRPEASLLLAIYWALFLWKAAREGRWWPPLGFAAGALVLAALPFALRWAYYQELLPNTYYAKSLFTVEDGLRYIRDLVHYLGIPLIAVAIAGALMAARSQPWLVVCLGVLTGYIVMVGGDVLSFRFGLFLVPWLMLAAGACFARIPPSWRGVAVGAGMSLLVVQSMRQMSTTSGEYFSQDGHLYVVNNARGMFETDARAGEYLAAHARPGDLLVTDNIGAVGYLSRLPVLDAYGLVSREIATLLARGDAARHAAAIRDARAPWILCYSIRELDGEHWFIVGGGEITPWARAQYEPVEHWVASTRYSRVLLRRRGPEPNVH
jgi:arabinofuranosyltransferase